MTLKEKILSDNYLEDYDNPITDYQAEKIVERADDYAIEFTEWICKHHVTDAIAFGVLDTKELLKKFKKQKLL